MSTPERPPPQSTVEAAGRIAVDMVNGLKTQPVLLALVLLNIVGIGAAAWFLHGLAGAQAERSKAVLDLLKACVAPGP